MNPIFVIPAKAGIQRIGKVRSALNWVSAFAGMTKVGVKEPAQ